METLGWLRDHRLGRGRRPVQRLEGGEIADLGNLSVEISQDSRIKSNLDIDTLFGILVSDARLGPYIRDILALIGPDEAQRSNMALKSAAFWSLVANSRQHVEVRDYLLKNLDRLKPDVRSMMKAQLDRSGGTQAKTT